MPRSRGSSSGPDHDSCWDSGDSDTGQLSVYSSCCARSTKNSSTRSESSTSSAISTILSTSTSTLSSPFSACSTDSSARLFR